MFGSGNKEDFLKELGNGIQRGVNGVYEKEKEEEVGSMEWEDKRDKGERIKEMF